MWKVGLFVGVICFTTSWNVIASTDEVDLVRNSSISTRNDVECEWQTRTTASLPDIPYDAVLGGFDRYKIPLYVARAVYNDEVHVVKVNPSRKLALFPYNNTEIETKEFEFLVGVDFTWVHVFDHIPSDAAIAGIDDGGNNSVYIGRAYYRDTLTVGEVRSDDKKLYITFRGEVHVIDNFEILVGPQTICSIRK